VVIYQKYGVFLTKDVIWKPEAREKEVIRMKNWKTTRQTKKDEGI